MKVPEMLSKRVCGKASSSDRVTVNGRARHRAAVSSKEEEGVEEEPLCLSIRHGTVQQSLSSGTDEATNRGKFSEEVDRASGVSPLVVTTLDKREAKPLSTRSFLFVIVAGSWLVMVNFNFNTTTDHGADFC